MTVAAVCSGHFGRSTIWLQTLPLLVASHPYDSASSRQVGINILIGIGENDESYNEFEEFVQDALILHYVVSDAGTGCNMSDHTKGLFFDLRRMRRIEYVVQL